jgi:hypothetical protein
MKKLFFLFIAATFFAACNNSTSHSNTDVNKDSVQTISHDSTITKPATSDTSDKSMGKDSTNQTDGSQK